MNDDQAANGVALITGITGQDGAYLARALLGRGYAVVGTSRHPAKVDSGNLQRLGIADRVSLVAMHPADLQSVLRLLDKVRPAEIYHLAGPSSVGQSFLDPLSTIEDTIRGNLNLLEALRRLALPARICSACSGECFGDTGGRAVDETSPFRPRSPYAVAKAASFWESVNYREAFGLFACSALLFNHESPLRSERFVTRKITSAVRRIAAGHREKLRLGDLTIRRDWGWAPEYVEALWRMLQQETAADFILATGASFTLEEFVAAAFAEVDLDWRDWVEIDPELFRPAEVSEVRADPSRARRLLGWEARSTLPDVVREMMRAERS